MRYSLGLDIGVASIGWAVIDEDKQRIHDLGVRIFERAEHPKTGMSLAKPRRDARSARRRLRRRRQRLNALKRFFVTHGLIDEQAIQGLFNIPSDPYELRVKGLDERLTNEELFLALYHIAKRRGYKSNRKSQEAKDAEGGKVLQAISNNELLLKAGGYRTVGEALLKDAKFAEHKRNKYDSYVNSFSREDFLAEMKAILDAQRRLGLPLGEAAVEELLFFQADSGLNGHKVYYGVFAQKPFMSGELMRKMIGDCVHERGDEAHHAKPRSPKASYSFELFRLAQDLVNVVIDTRGERRALTPEEMKKVIAKAHETKSITYKSVRKLIALPSESIFVYIRGKSKPEDPESNLFGKMEFYHDVKKALAGMPEWQQFADDPWLLDGIGQVLTIEKTDDDIRAGLLGLALPCALSEQAIGKLLNLSYTKFSAFSIKAMRKLIPFLLEGQSYSSAVASAGYLSSKSAKSVNEKLPPLGPDDSELITNPVVKRAVSQTIKLVNAVIDKYGSPYQIKIECARELAKSFKERNDIKKRQDDNHARNQRILDLLKEYGVITPTGQQIVKYKLYEQQNGQCLYSGEPISLRHLIEDDAAYEVDHIIPWSRCGDDSYGNKALVKREENQNKRNAIPYEAFGGDEKKWSAFKARVESLNLGRYKTSRCLAEKVADKEWSSHALKDTQYITRFLKGYIESNLAFSDPSVKQTVLSPAGSMTSYLGKRWGLPKDRAADVFHHARDAALVAAVTQKLINRVAHYSKYGELMNYHRVSKALRARGDIVDFVTGEVIDELACKQLEEQAFDHVKTTDHHFPRPWPRFDDEVRRRTANISQEQLQNELESFENYDQEFLKTVRPIFVSRMPNRKATGSLHRETLRSPRMDAQGRRTVRTQLRNVKLKDLEGSPVKDTDPQLYKLLHDRLVNSGDKPEKAFAEPVYKKDKRSNDVHQVRAIKVASKQISGFMVNKGRAFVNNGTMVRLDVYKKVNFKGKIEHFFVPVYAYEIHGPTPTRILPKAADITDVDDTFTKVTSLYPNDYVRIHFANKEGAEEGYYVKYGTASGQISLIDHAAPGKGREWLCAVSARSAVSIERFDASVLGDNIPRP